MMTMTGDTINNSTPTPLVPPLAIGDSVRIKGLISSSQYNDHKGLVVSYPPEITTNDGNDDRYGVRFRYNGSNKIVSIHISNLDFVHRSSSSSSAVIKANNGGNSSANEIMEEDEKMKQQIMHKREFDRIRLKYNLDNPSNAERIANMLSSSSSSSSSNNSTATVSATEFATTFGMQIPEAVIFLEWIMIGVKFKEDVLDKNKGV